MKITPPKTSRNYKGEQELVQYPKGIEPLAQTGSVTLFKQGKNFTVSYGLQVKSRLDYAEAAEVFGLCVLHEVQCEGLLD